MIPNLTDTGVLPPGIHTSTWTDFKSRFAVFDRSDRRLWVCEQLELLIDEIRKSTIVKRVLVCGSLVTSKPEPNDFDCILVLDPSIVGTELPPYEYNLMSRKLCRRKFAGDVISALDGSRALQEYLEFFQISREGQPMGIVELDL
jgi:hypothetical protein